MKKNILIFLLINIFFSCYSQAPAKFNYQGVARNTQGQVIANQNIALKVSILDIEINGTSIYSETHSAKTNQLGLFNIAIGGGTVLSGDFNKIPWSQNDKFIKIEMDPTGGTNYTLIGTSQLLSVPYALNAKTAESVQLKTQEVYYTDGMKISTIHNNWVSSPFDLKVDEDGTYLVSAIGRAWSPVSCSIVGRILNVTNGATLATSFIVGVDIDYAQQATGSFSKIAKLTKGDILRIDYNCMSNSSWQYGGDSTGGASSINIIKLGD